MGKLFSREMADALTAWLNQVSAAPHDVYGNEEVQMGQYSSVLGRSEPKTVLIATGTVFWDAALYNIERHFLHSVAALKCRGIRPFEIKPCDHKEKFLGAECSPQAPCSLVHLSWQSLDWQPGLKQTCAKANQSQLVVLINFNPKQEPTDSLRQKQTSK